MYTYAPSILTYTYEYVHMHILCIYSLLDDSILCAVPSNDLMTVNCKDEVVVQFRARSLNSPRGTEENHEKSQSR